MAARGSRRTEARLPESVAQRCSRLRRLGAEWRIEVPYFSRDDRDCATRVLRVNHYPPEGVTHYSFDEAVELLQIFCQRYTLTGQLPPPELEPQAVEHRTGSAGSGPPARFTLKEVDAEVCKLVPDQVPGRRALVGDEADRWLREHGADEFAADPDP